MAFGLGQEWAFASHFYGFIGGVEPSVLGSSASDPCRAGAQVSVGGGLKNLNMRYVTIRK